MSETNTAPGSCTACGTDLLLTPYSRDKKGRAFCKPCVAKLKQKQAAQAQARNTSSTGAAPLAPVEPGDHDVMAALLADSVQVTKRPCPDCQAFIDPEASICIYCGYNSKTGKRVSTRVIAAPKEKESDSRPDRAARSINLPSWSVYGSVAGVYLILGALSYDSEDLFMVFWAAVALFSLITFVWAIVAAFADGASAWALCGISSLVCGFTGIAFTIYVLFINDRGHLKGLYLVNFIANIALLIIAQQTGQLDKFSE